ncbi:MAG: LptF/LptG family permease, partial [Bacteroidota bacterium]
AFSLMRIDGLCKGLYTRTLAHARSINSQLFSTVRFLNKEKESRVKRVYELWSKFSFSLVCFIFLFIGAPMGAIVRKGGFGYPILVAILFFMLFIILTIACKKLAINLTLPPILAAWMPCIVLFPIGLILTYKAMNDSKMINVDRYLRFFNRLLRLAGGV